MSIAIGSLIIAAALGALASPALAAPDADRSAAPPLVVAQSRNDPSAPNPKRTGGTAQADPGKKSEKKIVRDRKDSSAAEAAAKAAGEAAAAASAKPQR